MLNAVHSLSVAVCKQMLLTQAWQLSEVPLPSFFFQRVEKNAKIDFFLFFLSFHKHANPPSFSLLLFFGKMGGGGGAEGYTVHVVKLSAREDEDNVVILCTLIFSVFPTCHR